MSFEKSPFLSNVLHASQKNLFPAQERSWTSNNMTMKKKLTSIVFSFEPASSMRGKTVSKSTIGIKVSYRCVRGRRIFLNDGQITQQREPLLLKNHWQQVSTS